MQLYKHIGHVLLLGLLLSSLGWHRPARRSKQTHFRATIH